MIAVLHYMFTGYKYRKIMRLCRVLWKIPLAYFTKEWDKVTDCVQYMTASSDLGQPPTYTKIKPNNARKSHEYQPRDNKYTKSTITILSPLIPVCNMGFLTYICYIDYEIMTCVPELIVMKDMESVHFHYPICCVGTFWCTKWLCAMR